MKNPIKWKYPIQQKLTDAQVIKLMHKNINNNTRWISTIFRPIFKPITKPSIETELHKYVITAPRNFLREISFGIGGLLAITLYFFTNIRRDIENDVEDPGRGIEYTRWIGHRTREIRYKGYLRIDTNSGFWLGNPNTLNESGKNSIIRIDKWKADYLALLQYMKYEKNRNTTFDFINFLDKKQAKLV